MFGKDAAQRFRIIIMLVCAIKCRIAGQALPVSKRFLVWFDGRTMRYFRAAVHAAKKMASVQRVPIRLLVLHYKQRVAHDKVCRGCGQAGGLLAACVTGNALDFNSCSGKRATDWLLDGLFEVVCGDGNKAKSGVVMRARMKRVARLLWHECGRRPSRTFAAATSCGLQWLTVACCGWLPCFCL